MLKCYGKELVLRSYSHLAPDQIKGNVLTLDIMTTNKHASLMAFKSVVTGLIRK